MVRCGRNTFSKMGECLNAKWCYVVYMVLKNFRTFAQHSIHFCTMYDHNVCTIRMVCLGEWKWFGG